MARTSFAVLLAVGAVLISTPAAAQQDPPPLPPSPPGAADPPLVPPPPAGEPAPPAAPPNAGTPIAPTETSETEADARQNARIRALEKRAAIDEKHIRRLEDRVRFFNHLRLEAFVQPQLLVQSWNAAASPNQQANGQLPPGIDANDTIAKTDGTTTNGTFFRVRRARMRTFYETDVMRLFLQIDALPAGGIGPGIGTILRNAEATGIAKWTRDVRTEFTAGLFFTPFRRELLEASVVRPFIERTWFIQNVFPTERDYGAHAKTIAIDDRLVVDLGIVNGQRLGEKTFTALPDLNRSKDFLGRVTYRLGPVTVGASGYVGRGQVVDPQGLRFKQFSKWAMNYEVAAEARIFRPLGETRLYSELAIARNMDTGVIYAFAAPAIPTQFTDDVANMDERAFYIRLEQDLGRRFVAGYRFDTYTPQTRIANNARDTHAFLAVAKVSKNLRWMNELGWAIDNVHAVNTPPPSKHIVMFSTVLQAMF